jgi:membrane-associated phospholipid phosphatase
MEQTSVTNQRDRSVYPPTALAGRPFLARHAWVGWLVFVLFGSIFAWLTWQVLLHTALIQGEAAQVSALHLWALRQPEWLVLLMRALSVLGRDGEALIALVLAIGWMRKKARRELYLLFYGMLAGELWFQALSNLIQRPRPQFPDPFETLKVPSFPSGHAVTTVLLAWLILYLLLPHILAGMKRFLLVLAVVAITLAICFSRLFLGLHYPSDVAGGIALGLAWGGLMYTAIDVRMFRRR